MRKSRDVIRWHAERRRRGGRRRRRRSQRRALIGRLRATVCVETIGPFVSPTARPPDGRPISARRRSPLDRQTASSAEIIKGISQKKQTNKPPIQLKKTRFPFQVKITCHDIGTRSRVIHPITEISSLAGGKREKTPSRRKERERERERGK